MSVAHEVLSQVPLAAVNPTLAFGGAAAVGVAVGAMTNFKKLTPHWHETIHEGDVGVWFRRGEPMLLPGYTEEDVLAAEEEDPYSTAVQHYNIVRRNWCLVRPFCTLQTVPVADQASVISFPIETAEVADNPRQQMNVSANVTWQVSPDGDMPARAITRVKHLKIDKKDAEARDTATLHRDELENVLKERVVAETSEGVGRVLNGWQADDLINLTGYGEEQEEKRQEVEQNAIAVCERRLIEYGVIVKRIGFVAIVRAPEEVYAQAIRSLSGIANPAVAAAVSLHANGNGNGNGNGSNGHVEHSKVSRLR